LRGRRSSRRKSPTICRRLHWPDVARRRKLAYDLDPEINIHRIAAPGRMVIEENVVSIGPKVRLRAQERPNLVERRTPNGADIADRDFPPHRCENPW